MAQSTLEQVFRWPNGFMVSMMLRQHSGSGGRQDRQRRVEKGGEWADGEVTEAGQSGPRKGTSQFLTPDMN